MRLILALLCLSSVTIQENATDNQISDSFVPVTNNSLVRNTTVFFTTRNDATTENIVREEEIEKVEEDSEHNSDENEIDTESIIANSDESFDRSFISSLLAEGDPKLVKVLIDNSKPENLDVFLNNSNITLEELEDFSESEF